MAAGRLSGYGVSWSSYVEEEVNRHVRQGHSPPSRVRELAGCDLSPAGDHPERFTSTAETDRQVLADAAAMGAVFIITEDVDDFGIHDLTAIGAAAVNPDLFLAIRASSGGYLEALSLISHRFKNPERTTEELHRHLGRVHPLTVSAHRALFPDLDYQPATHNAPSQLYRGNHCLLCFGHGPLSQEGLCRRCTR